MLYNEPTGGQDATEPAYIEILLPTNSDRPYLNDPYYYGMDVKMNQHARKPMTTEEMAAYHATLAQVEQQRLALRQRYLTSSYQDKEFVLYEAGRFLEKAIADDIGNFWVDTPFDRNGTCQTPESGKIGCSFFVSTLFEAAGMKLNRLKVGQKSALGILKTFCDTTLIRRWTNPYEVERWLQKERGTGLYIIAFNFHVGFVYYDGTDIKLFHASSLPPRAVVKLPIHSWEAAHSFDYSPHYDLGRIGDHLPLVKKWLLGERVN